MASFCMFKLEDTKYDGAFFISFILMCCLTDADISRDSPSLWDEKYLSFIAKISLSAIKFYVTEILGYLTCPSPDLINT